MHHATWSLKLSILSKVERSNDIVVRIPIIFSEVGGHDEFAQHEDKKLSEE